MLSENLVFVQLAQVDDYVCIVELANSLEASVSEVRQRLKELGDRVENDGKDRWRLVKKIATENQLTEEERIERDALESTVQQAFFLAGQALKRLREQKLYRETHRSFKSYVKDRFDFTKAAAYYLIHAAEVVENLKGQQIVDPNKSTTILPTKESQCRPLTKLSPEQQREVWCSAVAKAQGKVPSARIVKEIVNQNNSDSLIQQPPKNQEIIYQPGTGIDYIVHLDEETYRLLETYQAKIGTATKRGAIRRLLEDAIAE